MASHRIPVRVFFCRSALAGPLSLASLLNIFTLHSQTCKIQNAERRVVWYQRSAHSMKENVKVCATTQVVASFFGLLFSIWVGMVAIFDATPALVPVASLSPASNNRGTDIFTPPQLHNPVSITNNISTNCPILEAPSTRLVIHKAPKRRQSTESQ